MFQKELVIAAYDKPLDWLSEVPKNVKITIYRKGKNHYHENEIYIEKNVGRCVHTFFNHLYKNYNNLAEFTFFAQDYPFDHWNNLIECLNSDIDIYEKKCAIYYKQYYGFDTLYNGATRPADNVGLGKVLFCDLGGEPNHGGLPLTEIWKLLFSEQHPPYFEFNPGGHFIISAEHAHKRTKNFYGLIVNLLENGYENMSTDLPSIPYCIERLENYIFNDRYQTII